MAPVIFGRAPRDPGDQIREILCHQPPSFAGSTNGVEAEPWLLSLDRCFGLHPYESNLKAQIVIHLLRGTTSTWGRQEEYKNDLARDTVTWDIFIERFKDRYLSKHYRQCKIDKFHDLQQKGLSMS